MKIKLAKSSLIALTFVWVIFGFQLHAYAMGMGKNPIQKLGRGVIYVVAAPLQLPKEIIQTAAEAEPVWLAPWKGFAEGAGTGLYAAGRQGIAGIWDIFTFWTPAGRNWGPLFDSNSLFPEV